MKALCLNWAAALHFKACEFENISWVNPEPLFLLQHEAAPDAWRRRPRGPIMQLVGAQKSPRPVPVKRYRPLPPSSMPAAFM
jgi:hypothetical protein